MALSLIRHGSLSRATMEHFETKHQVKQEPTLIMPLLKRKKEEDDDDDVVVSTELSVWLDYEPTTAKKIKKPRIDDQKDEFLKANDVDQDQDLVIKRKKEEDDDVHVVSTELSVWLDYEPTAEKIKKPRIDDQKDSFLKAIDVDQDQDLVTRDFVSGMAVNAMAYSSSSSLAISSSRGVSTVLELYCDPWKIKKILTKSDLGDLSRLLIRTSCVETHVFPLMGVDGVKQVVQSKDGLRVGVWDYDTHSMHQLDFKKWPSSKAYVLTLNWNKDFVKRRNLKEKDQIALFWDPHRLIFWFHILDP
ncbi:hypothetical protein Ddye_011335 [Dipteronia dyeriana]|uniref:B3 domain-containing protein n=1 Tax=Dipteronia dyeriana TaxID=168575 RepID=A0AAD9X2C1_9ROSI|nr:hypothetical protein Ddye_011335 [Dipteronia dyeriana]